MTGSSRKDGQVAADNKRKPRMDSLRASSVAIVIVAGLAIGALLALGAASLIRHVCLSQPDCQRQAAALLGGFALMQTMQIVVVYFLVDRLNRQSEARILRALRHHGGSTQRIKS